MIATNHTAASNTWLKSSAYGDVMVQAEADDEFVLPTQLPTKMLLLSADEGITATLPMMRELQTRHYQGDVVFMHVCRDPDALGFADELQTAADNFAELSLLVHYEELAGVFTPDTLHYAVPDLAERSTWVCGSNRLTNALRHHWDASAITVPLHCASPLSQAQPAAPVLHA